MRRTSEPELFRSDGRRSPLRVRLGIETAPAMATAKLGANAESNSECWCSWPKFKMEQRRFQNSPISVAFLLNPTGSPNCPPAASRRPGCRPHDAWPRGATINSPAKFLGDKDVLEGQSFWLDLFAHVVGPMWRVSCGAAVAGHYVQHQRSEAQC